MHYFKILTTRAGTKRIKEDYQLIKGKKFFVHAFEVFPDIVLVLDSDRQIVYGNSNILSFLGITDINAILGKRPGETFQCIHAEECPSGCGGTEDCKECNALKAILCAQQGKDDYRHCQLKVKEGTGEKILDFDIRTSPVTIEDKKFTIFTVKNFPLPK